jgi:hypothetical protein
VTKTRKKTHLSAKPLAAKFSPDSNFGEKNQPSVLLHHPCLPWPDPRADHSEPLNPQPWISASLLD